MKIHSQLIESQVPDSLKPFLAQPESLDLRAYGGAWKVAYADFVTAMMALFMVLWICSQDKEILLETAKYFQSPFNSPLRQTYGVMDDGSPSYNQDGGQATTIMDMAFLHRLAEEFVRLLELDDMEVEKPIDVRVTPDGLRITLFDQSKQPLFEPYSDELTSWGDFTLQNLSWILDRYEMKVRIDAFTSALQEDGQAPEGYDPFNITAMRANKTQKTLKYYGLNRAVDRITGFGDTRTLDGVLATSDRNQRIEISLVL
jgi:chemotaxis protein MotB